MSGIELRPLNSDEAPALVEVIAAAHRYDGFPQVFTEAELLEELGAPGFDPVADGRIAYLDGVLAGWSRIWHQPSSDRLERAYIIGTVHPDFRFKGVGRALLGWGRERATERLLGRVNDLPKFIRIDASDQVPDAHHLYREMGFTPIRWFEDLVRPIAGFAAPATPEGIAIVPWAEAGDDEVRQVHNAAFRDHWGSTALDIAGWRHLLGGHGTRPDLSWVAVDRSSGAVVGFAVNAYFPDDEALHAGRRDGWILQLGTLDRWRRRGVASALIGASVASFAAAGCTHVALNVDSDNPSGAASLYRALGFEAEYRSITHQIEVRAATGGGGLPSPA